MPKKCAPSDHEKLKAFGHDRHCTRCGVVVNEEALVTVNCETKNQIHASRGLKHCPDCGETLVLS